LIKYKAINFGVSGMVQIVLRNLTRLIHTRTEWIEWMCDGAWEAKRETPI